MQPHRPIGRPALLAPVLGNSQRLDGGAMFGNAPRALWSRWSPPDDENRITLACRAMLIREDSGRTILFEAGIGAFFAPDLRERFGVQESHHVLLDSLKEFGVDPEEVDIVVLSHLHFDHAGGLLTAYEAGKAPELVFPNARYVIGREAFERAQHPHPRDRASFIPELLPLLATRELELLDAQDGEGPLPTAYSQLLGPTYRFHLSEGHTPGLLLAELETPEGPVLFGADLIPGLPWVHLPITMGYDRFPERIIDEKTALLADLYERHGLLFFTHDPECALARLQRDPRGRYSAQSLSLNGPLSL